MDYAQMAIDMFNRNQKGLEEVLTNIAGVNKDQEELASLWLVAKIIEFIEENPAVSQMGIWVEEINDEYLDEDSLASDFITTENCFLFNGLETWYFLDDEPDKWFEEQSISRDIEKLTAAANRWLYKTIQQLKTADDLNMALFRWEVDTISPHEYFESCFLFFDTEEPELGLQILVEDRCAVSSNPHLKVVSDIYDEYRARFFYQPENAF